MVLNRLGYEGGGTWSSSDDETLHSKYHEVLIGLTCRVQVEHNDNGGKTYANIAYSGYAKLEGQAVVHKESTEQALDSLFGADEDVPF